MDYGFKSTKWIIFIALSLTIMMVDLDITAVNLALAVIAQDLTINLPTAQWIIDGYMIAAAACMALGGRVTDIYGTRKIFFIGLILFAISSLAVGLAIGPWSILISRLIQGACIAFIFPVALVIVRFVFPKEEIGFASGLLIAIAGFSQALGPTVGGIIIHLMGWRWIFFLDVPLALFALAIAWYNLKIPNYGTKKEPLYIGSAAILVTGLLALMTALNEVAIWGIDSLRFIGLLIIGLILLVVFAYIEFHTKKPLLELKLLLNKTFLYINLVRIYFNFIYFAMLFTLGLLLQNVLHYSALNAGYILLALTLTFGILSIPAGKLIDKIRPQRLIFTGFALLVTSNILLTLVSSHKTLPFMLVTLFIAGVAIALLVPATGTAALFAIPPEKSGAGMGVFLTNAFIGGSLGVAISGWILTVQSKTILHHLISLTPITLTQLQWHKLEQAANGIMVFQITDHLFVRELLLELQPMVQRAFISGFSSIMWLCAILGIVSCLLTLRIKDDPK